MNKVCSVDNGNPMIIWIKNFSIIFFTEDFWNLIPDLYKIYIERAKRLRELSENP